MKAARGIEVLDPYEWLPGYGESAVRVRTEGPDLIVGIEYDCGESICQRELRFSSVCSFYSQLFPGPPMVDVEEMDAPLLLRGVLVEYPESKIAKAWTKHLNSLRIVRHFNIVFSAENLLLVIMASEVSLGEQVARSS